MIPLKSNPDRTNRVGRHGTLQPLMRSETRKTRARRSTTAKSLAALIPFGCSQVKATLSNFGCQGDSEYITRIAPSPRNALAPASRNDYRTFIKLHLDLLLDSRAALPDASISVPGMTRIFRLELEGLKITLRTIVAINTERTRSPAETLQRNVRLSWGAAS